MKTTLFPLLLLLLAACSNPVEMNRLEQKNDLYYQKGDKSPFTGDAITYFPSDNKENRRVYEEGSFRYGRKHGTWTTWKWDGSREEANFVNGKRHKSTYLYDDNNRKIGEHEYKNGLLHGYSYTWNPESGEMTDVAYYQEGAIAQTNQNPFNDRFSEILNKISDDFRDATASGKDGH